MPIFPSSLRCSTEQLSGSLGVLLYEMRLGASVISGNHVLIRIPCWRRFIHPPLALRFSSFRPLQSEGFVTTYRQTSPPPNPRAQNIAVLGGGITGLATAFDLSRAIPDAKIVIYEREKRLGGWLNSEHVQVPGGEVLFEWGPRSIRPDQTGAGAATISLVHQTSHAP